MAWELRNLRNPEDTDVVIAIPHTGTVRFDWALSYAHLDKIPNLYWISAGAQGQPIDLTRNIFVTQALQKHAQYLFFLDSDVEIPHDGLTKLYDSRKPIAAGLYSQRSPPYGLSANIGKRTLTVDVLQKYPDRLIDVHEIGMGCCLINMRVIDRMARNLKLQWRCLKSHGKELGLNLPPDVSSPKEIMVYTNKEASENQWHCKICGASIVADFFHYTIGNAISQEKGPFSEDYYFCANARKVGFPISVHTGVFCAHELPNMKITKEGLMNPVQSANEI